MKKWKWDRMISVATLGSSLIAIVLVLKKPHPVAPPMPAAVAAAKAESFQEKVEQFEQPKQPGQAPAEVHLSSDEISAAFAQAAGMIPIPQTQSQQTASGLSPSSVPPTSADAAFGPGQPEVKDYQVNFDGDVARPVCYSDRRQGCLRHTRRASRLERRLCHVRSHGVQGRRPQYSSLAGERGPAETTHRATRPPET